MKRLALFAVASIAAAVPAASFAQAQAPQQQQPAAAVDPNEVICQKQEVIGSRIATKRICLKRWEWAERQRQDRSDVEKVQVQRGIRGE